MPTSSSLESAFRRKVAGPQKKTHSPPIRNLIPAVKFADSAGYPTTDRKSTRLNSSHLVISYAVFCLKKKQNRQGWACLLIRPPRRLPPIRPLRGYGQRS